MLVFLLRSVIFWAALNNAESVLCSCSFIIPERSLNKFLPTFVREHFLISRRLSVKMDHILVWNNLVIFLPEGFDNSDISIEHSVSKRVGYKCRENKYKITTTNNKNLKHTIWHSKCFLLWWFWRMRRKKGKCLINKKNENAANKIFSVRNWRTQNRKNYDNESAMLFCWSVSNLSGKPCNFTTSPGWKIGGGVRFLALKLSLPVK